MENKKNLQKVSKGKIIGGIIIILWQLTLDNQGFSTVSGSEATGFNLFTLTMYGVGLWLIYRGFYPKKIKETV
jgi:hypothetical protein